MPASRAWRSWRRCGRGRPCRNRRESGVVFGEQGAELVEVLVEDLLGGMRLEVAAKHLLLAGHDAQLDGRVERFVELEVRRDALFARKAFERAAGFSLPTTQSREERPPTLAMLTATLAAPPRRSSVRLMRTRGTGASGEMRSASPNQ